MSLSVLYGFRELRVVRLLCTWVPVSTRVLNDALLGVHCITRITRPHSHCFSDPRLGALSPTKLRVHPLKMSLSTHFVRSKSSSLANRLAFVKNTYSNHQTYEI